MRRRRQAAILLAPLLPVALLWGVLEVPGVFPDRLERIQRRGRLHVLTRNNAHCYYLYREEPLGFEYELARAFADTLGVALEVLTPHWDDLLPSLRKGTGDLVAASLTRTPTRASRVDFCKTYLPIEQRLISRKGIPPIHTLAELAGREVHVRRGSSYQARLEELIAEGIDLQLVLHEDLSTEELLRRVAEGEIELTVADNNVAILNRRYYPDLRIGLPLTGTQNLCWAVQKGETALRKRVNRFFEQIFNDGTFDRLYEKYYANTEVFDYVDLKLFQRRLRTRLPRYRDLIEEVAEEHDLDWRLVAAVIYQESHFNPRARSHTGPVGLMQFTRTTAREMGIANRLDPEESIRGGVAYLQSLYDRFPQTQGLDRLLLALASYNVGLGHVRDAQSLARRQGLDPNRWSSVRETLPLLRQRRFYRDSEYGYCRGTEPIRYVSRILTYYEILKRQAIGTARTAADR